jgi:hypothetical protein
MGDVAVGPGIAWLAGDGVALDVDVSLTYAIFSASVAPLFVRADGVEAFGARGELTAWFFANLGGGVGYLGGPWDTLSAHLFVGVPVGEELSDFLGDSWGPFNMGFFEPYYRVTFFPGTQAETLHELGMYFKLSTWD